MTSRAPDYRFQVRLYDTDAAGVLFYGHLFRHAHDAYESYMAGLGFPLEDLIAGTADTPPLHLPIIEAQAKYLAPLRQGQRLLVELRVSGLRRRSFALDYRFIDAQGTLSATARTVHCLIPSPEVPNPALPEALALALAGDAGVDGVEGAATS